MLKQNPTNNLMHPFRETTPIRRSKPCRMPALQHHLNPLEKDFKERLRDVDDSDTLRIRSYTEFDHFAAEPKWLLTLLIKSNYYYNFGFMLVVTVTQLKNK